jgi:hypothetical protein
MKKEEICRDVSELYFTFPPTPAGFLLGSYFDPKDGCDMLLPNVGMSTNYSSAYYLLLLLSFHDLLFDTED